MKRVLIFSALFVSLLAVSCGGPGNGSAKATADRFAKAFFVEMNFDACRRYVAPELTDEFPESGKMNELEKHFVRILADHAAEYGYRFEYDAESSVADQESANIFYTLTAKANPDWTGRGDVVLARDADGKWRVTDYAFDRDEAAIDFGF